MYKLKRNLSVFNRQSGLTVSLTTDAQLLCAGTFNPETDNTMFDDGGVYIINGVDLDYVGEDEPDWVA
jgi:hypothetical protein